MKTILHKRLESMCKKLRTSKHWLVKDSHVVRIPSLGGEIVTTKRAIYAAFVGPIGEGEEVRTNCGVARCVAPDHLALTRARSKAGALSIPEFGMLGKPDVYQAPEPRLRLPKNITRERVLVVKHMASTSNTLAQIRDATGLHFADIVRAMNGAYDRALEAAEEASTAARAARETKKEAKDSQVVEKKEPGQLTDEEREWLGTIGKG